MIIKLLARALLVVFIIVAYAIAVFLWVLIFPSFFNSWNHANYSFQNDMCRVVRCFS